MAKQTNIRLLAAIMFADIVGYSKMMQENEEVAKNLRDIQRSVIEENILKYHGQVMQYYGDGTLMMFGSSSKDVFLKKLPTRVILTSFSILIG